LRHAPGRLQLPRPRCRVQGRRDDRHVYSCLRRRRRVLGHAHPITSGKAAGYEGVISAFKHASAVYYTIPALPEMPDEHSKFTLQPLNSLQPNVHLAACTATSGMGCTAYGVEWAKTIGWPVGQAKLTSNTPTNVETGVRGPWTAIGTSGGTVGATSATVIQLALADEVKDVNHYKTTWSRSRRKMQLPLPRRDSRSRLSQESHPLRCLKRRLPVATLSSSVPIRRRAQSRNITGSLPRRAPRRASMIWRAREITSSRCRSRSR